MQTGELKEYDAVSPTNGRGLVVLTSFDVSRQKVVQIAVQKVLFFLFDNGFLLRQNFAVLVVKLAHSFFHRLEELLEVFFSMIL